MSKEYYKNNKDKWVVYSRRYRQENKEKRNEESREWRKNNQEHIKDYNKIYYQNNTVKSKECSIQWRKNNPEKYRVIRNKCKRKKYRINLKYNLSEKMGAMVRLALKGNKAGRHWEDLVGYTISNLINRLKKTMPEGYAWQDYLEGRLHLDHKIPISVFNFTKPEHIDFKRCWSLRNLQLLPAKENIRKKNKLLEPFQPTLEFKEA